MLLKLWHLYGTLGDCSFFSLYQHEWAASYGALANQHIIACACGHVCAGDQSPGDTFTSDWALILPNVAFLTEAVGVLFWYLAPWSTHNDERPFAPLSNVWQFAAVVVWLCSQISQACCWNLGKCETIIANALRIHRNYAERASSEPAADWSYATLVEKASSNIMYQVLCNAVVVTKIGVFPSSYSGFIVLKQLKVWVSRWWAVLKRSSSPVSGIMCVPVCLWGWWIHRCVLVSQGNHVWQKGSDQKCRHVGGHAAGRRGVCHSGPGEVQHRERHRCIY